MMVNQKDDIEDLFKEVSKEEWTKLTILRDKEYWSLYLDGKLRKEKRLE